METRLAVRLMYSNAQGVAPNPQEFWNLIHGASENATIPILAIINNALIFRGAMNLALHVELEAEFSGEKLRRLVSEQRAKFDDSLVLFNRPANLLIVKLLLGVEHPKDSKFEL